MDLESEAQRSAPIHIAVQQQNVEMARVFLKAGADVNVAAQRGLAPIHAAAKIGHAEIFQALIEAGADVNAATQDGRTPVHRC